MAQGERPGVALLHSFLPGAGQTLCQEEQGRHERVLLLQLGGLSHLPHCWVLQAEPCDITSRTLRTQVVDSSHSAHAHTPLPPSPPCEAGVLSGANAKLQASGLSGVTETLAVTTAQSPCGATGLEGGKPWDAGQNHPSVGLSKGHFECSLDHSRRFGRRIRSSRGHWAERRCLLQGSRLGCFTSEGRREQKETQESLKLSSRSGD